MLKTATDMKVCRMIAGPRHATANGASSSARTYGSGGNTTGFGVVDRKGFDFATFYVAWGAFKSAASRHFVAFHQSHASSLCASASNASGRIASTYMSSQVGASAKFNVFRVNLEGKKRYLNCRVKTCVTSGAPEVVCLLSKGDTLPPSHGSLAAFVRNM